MFKKIVAGALMVSGIWVGTAATAAAAGSWHGPQPSQGQCQTAEDMNHSNHGGDPGIAYTCRYLTNQPEGAGWYYFYS
ncbi:hypothetical protein [Nocardia arthritidis]|uniref:Uncharacterized protein n=1 Tax=Nocardia arthritidis TaxID=228602 RepID=A0A6G9YCY7_9NOCA|nr:hypothetical protein [Nocardia arthritidis]QIS11038.1 hypothetical protein F5544_15785 [Nocardia arthritidis]